MTDPPVTTSEIANLLHRIRELSDTPTADPAERAEVLAGKADLLARLANQRADDWGCEHADQARQLAHEARTTAGQLRLNSQPAP
jgi:hypothetical protein